MGSIEIRGVLAASAPGGGAVAAVGLAAPEGGPPLAETGWGFRINILIMMKINHTTKFIRIRYNAKRNIS